MPFHVHQRATRRRHAEHGGTGPLSANKFEPQDAAALAAELVGTVVLATDDAYEASRHGFFRAREAFPQIICFCEVPRDVRLCLAFARKHGLTPVCRSGGHSTAEYSVNDQLVIDVGRINYVVVDRASRTARVGAGTQFEMLEGILSPFGLHVPGGGCPSVAVGGYMQGGGYSFTSQMYGMNCDSVIAATVVLANGDIVDTNEKDDPELFWAIRGGTGNNFGVLVEITYQLHEPGEMQGFGFRWPLAKKADRAAASKALGVWQDNYLGDQAIADMGSEAFIVEVARDPAKGVKPELLIRGMYRGDEAAATAALAPLAAACPDGGTHDIWQRGTYEDLNGYLMSHPTELPDVPPNVRAFIQSRIIAEPVGTDDWLRLLEYFTSAGAGALMIVIEAYGGAINEPAPDKTAFVHRGARMDVFGWSFWMLEHQRRKAEKCIDGFLDLIEPLSNGHSYQNYPNRKTPAHRYPDLYWGDNYPRLQRAKARYDPDPLFRFEQMVHPPKPT